MFSLICITVAIHKSKIRNFAYILYKFSPLKLFYAFILIPVSQAMLSLYQKTWSLTRVSQPLKLFTFAPLKIFLTRKLFGN